MHDREFGSPEVRAGAVESFYEKVATRHAPSTPWSELPEEWRAFYQDLMVTAVHEELPVFYAWNPVPREDGKPAFLFQTLTSEEYPATPETDRLIASTVLNWAVDGDRVLVPNRHSSDPPIAIKVPEQWSPTTRLADAEVLLHWLKYWEWSLHLDDHRRSKYQDQGWWFEVCRVDGMSENEDDDAIPTHYYELDGGAPTLQLAICRAALHAVKWMREHPDEFKGWVDWLEREGQHDPWH
jgi:hypothetical protein